MMSSREPQAQADGRAEFVESVWDRIRTHLLGERHRIYEEIRTYPRPVAGCDQQFNYLLEERARISAELERMDRARAESRTGSNPLEQVEAFLNSSRYLKDDAGHSLRSFSKDGLPGQGG
jgi:hypothetical protein